MAMPRILLGKSSEKSTHITGPMLIAKEATKPKIANKINIEFMWMDAVMSCVLLAAKTSLPRTFSAASV